VDISTVCPVNSDCVVVKVVPGKTNVGIPATVTVNSDKLLFIISTNIF
jgi:hypothetical protein